MNKKKIILDVIIAILLIICAVSGFMAIKNYIDRKNEQRAFDNIAEDAEKASEEENVDMWQYYRDLNEDFDGILTIDGTVIDYPVVYTPDNVEYYLRRGFDGEYSFSGTPFIGYYCNSNSDLFIIYSHCMKNGTMFGSLSEYKDADYLNEHKNITYTVEGEIRTYEVFAAFSTSVNSDDSNYFDYFNYAGDLTEERFITLRDWATGNSDVVTGIAPEYGDQILILSTCINGTDGGRYIVLAYRTTPQE